MATFFKIGLTGLMLAIGITASFANPPGFKQQRAENLDATSGFDVTGFFHPATGKFANQPDTSETATIQSNSIPQAASVPTTLLVESTLSRQYYAAQSPICATITALWPAYQNIFEVTLTPQNLSSGPNVIEINYSAQVTSTSSATDDGISLTCLVCQPGDCTNSVPCSNTSGGPYMVRNRNAGQRNVRIMATYQGFAQIDNTEPVKVIIGSSNTRGITGYVCNSNLILRTR